MCTLYHCAISIERRSSTKCEPEDIMETNIIWRRTCLLCAAKLLINSQESVWVSGRVSGTNARVLGSNPLMSHLI